VNSRPPAARSRPSGHLDAEFDQRYRDWIRRGQLDDAAAVLAETAAAAGSGQWDAVPGASQRIAYCRSIAALALDDVRLALTEADRIVEAARQDGSAAFEAVGCAIRSKAHSRAGGFALAVEALAAAEAAIEFGLAEERLDEWVNAQILHGVACARLGLCDRAVDALERALESGLSESETFNRVVLVVNLARWRLIQAAAGLRAPPFRLDPDAFDGACAVAIQAGHWLAERGDRLPWVDVELWQGLHAAWAGDPAVAVEQLAPYLPGRRRRELGELWPIAQAGRLRALGRLGRGEELAAALADGDGWHAEDQDAFPLGGGLILLWERTRAQHRELEDPHSPLGRLELARERQRADRQAALNDVVELRVQQLREHGERQRLTEVNRTDHLTGVLNRRGFEPIMQTAARTPSGVVALMMVDIDRFKRVNDTRGHVVGDETLRRLGDALAGAARGDDVVARLGGDEFAVLARLQGEDETGATVLADRILDSARRTLRDPTGITVSLGCAIRAAPVDVQAWLKLADGAMYAAKRAGGDRMNLVRC
jgi:diguanylate cyclase (GGDEF)-like protein